MTIRFADATEKDNWNTKIINNPDGGNVFQGLEFAEQKKLSGWAPRLVVAGDISMTIHEKSVPSLGKLWYLPKGPGVASPDQLAGLLPDLKTFAAKHSVFAVKLEPELLKTTDTEKLLSKLELRKVAPVQPNFSTILIDLTPDLDTIMKNFNQKSRHAIRRAQRDGVSVKRVKATEKNCRLFYDMLVKTATAQGFLGGIRPFDYHLQYWQNYAHSGHGQLFFAYFEARIVAGAFALIYGAKSTYKDAASERVEGAYGVTHLMQWHIIQWAKEQGSTLHDLCGSPPSDRINDTSHPHYGVGRFKTSFNKHVTDYVGAYDLVVKPRQYTLWTKFGERAAKSLWWRAHHESWY